VPADLASEIITISEKYKVKAKQIGYVESNDTTEIVIDSEHGVFVYN